MQLSKKTLAAINAGQVTKPTEAQLNLPEKVLQFGTGVLLRGLPDYFIHQANEQSLFNGRIVVVKSTDAGDLNPFTEQDNLYTLCIRGIEEGKQVSANVICAAISRVISAKKDWKTVLECAANAAINIIISNTTEVGIQLVRESIFQTPPVSFPAKLLIFLYERFKMLGDTDAAKTIVLPTELISDNGKKLQAILIDLAQHNQLEEAFFNWFYKRIIFCNTLVDCIVPGKPDAAMQLDLQEQLGYTDALLSVTEAYRLWAIEGNTDVKKILSFAEADNRIIITPDITKYKELKLRLLNGTHTATCGLAFLAGISTVKEAMENKPLCRFITNVMLQELAAAIPYPIPKEEAIAFGLQVLDRFRNPHLQHQWVSITMQYSSKIAMRVVPVLQRYIELYRKIPECIALGFAAYLLFMKVVKKEDTTYYGFYGGDHYPINDAAAPYYFELWQQKNPDEVVHAALQNETLWGTDLMQLPHFEKAVQKHLHQLLQKGALQAAIELQAETDTN